MELTKWILDELEDMPVETLADMAEREFLKPLLINDGRIVECEEKETLGAATPRESK